MRDTLRGKWLDCNKLLHQAEHRGSGQRKWKKFISKIFKFVKEKISVIIESINPQQCGALSKIIFRFNPTRFVIQEQSPWTVSSLARDLYFAGGRQALIGRRKPPIGSHRLTTRSTELFTHGHGGVIFCTELSSILKLRNFLAHLLD
jgi:hypothetical protein